MRVTRYGLAVAVAAAWFAGRADAQSMTGVAFGTVPPRAPATPARGVAGGLQAPPALHSVDAVGPAATRGLAPNQNQNRFAAGFNPYTAGHFAPSPYTAGARAVNQYNAGSFSPNPYTAGAPGTALAWPVPGFQPTADQLRAANQFRVGTLNQFGRPDRFQFGAANQFGALSQFGTVNQPGLVNQFGTVNQFGQLGGINQLRTANGVRGVGFPGFDFGAPRTVTPPVGRR